MKEKSKLLTSYKGVGHKIASILLIEVPELGRLDNKEIVCLVGVAPKTNESGRKVGKAQIIGGRFYARKALYMSAVVVMCHNGKMKVLYQRLVDSGKAAKVALVAVMRKIIICLNAKIKVIIFILMFKTIDPSIKYWDDKKWGYVDDILPLGSNHNVHAAVCYAT